MAVARRLAHRTHDPRVAAVRPHAARPIPIARALAGNVLRQEIYAEDGRHRRREQLAPAGAGRRRCVAAQRAPRALARQHADRLFKIRNGLNIEGVARPLALYEPPIDPGLLARAAASGVDVGAALSEVDAALPPYRFMRSLQAALDLCQEVRGLGAAILSALERRDAEDIARVRATQELALLETLRAVRANALADAQAGRAVLETARDTAVVRRDYYASREFVNAAELTGLVLSGAAVTAELAATLLDALAAAAHMTPTLTAGAAGFGGSPTATVTHGGGSVGNSASAAASALRGAASTSAQGGNLASTVGSYQRRRDEWNLQRRIAEKEIVQLERQLVGAELRIAMAQRELDAHDRQIEDARTTSELLATKFTSRELYDWMLSQLSTTYFQAYQLAYDLARRASKAYAFELDGVDPGYVQFGYWDNLHRGLCAGDKLMLDLRRLEAEYLRRNRRELELTKHVPLARGSTRRRSSSSARRERASSTCPSRCSTSITRDTTCGGSVR